MCLISRSESHVDENRDFSLRKLHLIDYFDHPDKNGTENSCCKEKYSGCLCLVLTVEGKIVINLKKTLNPRNFQVLLRKAKEDGL